MPNLESVSLHQTSADDRTCEALARLTELRTVVLYGTKVTERGAQLLASLPTIRFLNVAATEVPAALVAELAAIGRRRGKLAFGARSL